MQSDLHKIIVSSQPLTPDHVKVFLYQILRGECCSCREPTRQRVHLFSLFFRVSRAASARAMRPPGDRFSQPAGFSVARACVLTCLFAQIVFMRRQPEKSRLSRLDGAITFPIACSPCPLHRSPAFYFESGFWVCRAEIPAFGTCATS